MKVIWDMGLVTYFLGVVIGIYVGWGVRGIVYELSK